MSDGVKEADSEQSGRSGCLSGELAALLMQDLRAADADLYLTLLVAPSGVRQRLLPLFALWAQIHRSAQQASEPMIGEIRLAWWREHLPNALSGESRGHPILQAVTQQPSAFAPILPDIDSVLDAYVEALYAPSVQDLPALQGQLNKTHGKFLRLAVQLAGQADAVAVETAQAVAAAWGASRLYQRLPEIVATEQGADLLAGESPNVPARLSALESFVSQQRQLARQNAVHVSVRAAAPLRLLQLAKPHWQAESHALQRLVSMGWASLRQAF